MIYLEDEGREEREELKLKLDFLALSTASSPLVLVSSRRTDPLSRCAARFFLRSTVNFDDFCNLAQSHTQGENLRTATFISSDPTVGSAP